MFKFCIKLFLIVLLPLALNYSQKKSNISVLISANLTKEKYIQLPGNLNFDKIDITHNAKVISRTPGKGIKIKIAGYPDKKIVLTYSSIDINNFQWASQNDSEKGTLSFTPDIECSLTNNSNSKPISLKSGCSCTLPDFDGDGILYLWIGGKIKLAENQPGGNYFGIFKINISYE